MFCRNCDYEMDERAAVCIKCGVRAETAENAAFCTRCGVELRKTVPIGERKSKLAAGLMGIFLGGLGIHNFYLGHIGRGAIQIVLTFFTCGFGAVWGLIEGIMILAGAIKTDAKGIPLKD